MAHFSIHFDKAARFESELKVDRAKRKRRAAPTLSGRGTPQQGTPQQGTPQRGTPNTSARQAENQGSGLENLTGEQLLDQMQLNKVKITELQNQVERLQYQNHIIRRRLDSDIFVQ